MPPTRSRAASRRAGRLPPTYACGVVQIFRQREGGWVNCTNDEGCPPLLKPPPSNRARRKVGVCRSQSSGGTEVGGEGRTGNKNWSPARLFPFFLLTLALRIPGDSPPIGGMGLLHTPPMYATAIAIAQSRPCADKSRAPEAGRQERCARRSTCHHTRDSAIGRNCIPCPSIKLRGALAACLR